MSQGLDNPNAKLQDRYGNRIDETTFFIMPPVQVNDTIRISCNFGYIQNAGTMLLIIDENFTLKPGGVFNFGSQHNPSMCVKTLHIKFVTNPDVVTQTPRAEWVQYYYNGLDQVFYRSRGKQEM